VWQELATASQDAVVYQTPEWTDACCSAGGYHDRSRLYEMPDGRRLILPLMSDGTGLGATQWSLPPGWGQGGILAAAPVTPQDVAAVVEDIRRQRIRTVIKPGIAGAGLWTATPACVRRPHSVHVVELGDGFEDLWVNRLSASARSKVRRAEKANVTLDWDTTGALVPVAWDLYLRWATHRGAQEGLASEVSLARAYERESLEQFQAVAAALGERCRVAVASVDGEPIAFMTLLVHGRHAQYWRGYSDPTSLRGRYPNQLLLIRLIEEAAKAGCDDVHLGESGGVRGLEQFKESLGGEVRSYDELRFEGPAVRAARRLRAISRQAGVRGARTLQRVLAGSRTPG
jgi:hypothetical protein